MTRYRARLVGWREVAPLTRHFTFEITSLVRLNFVPGQFFSFTAEVGERIVTRAYSVASVPRENQFDICLNLVEGGKLSTVLFGLEPGGEMDVTGPFGAFIFREPADTVLVATGTGVVPFRGMLLDILDRNEGHNFTLICGARHEHGLLYREEFEELAACHSSFEFVPTLTRPGKGWAGRTGRVQRYVLDVVGERRDWKVYICGMKEMVDDVRGRLKAVGFDRKQIVVEKYD